MKLLLDENLSRRLVPMLASVYPDSQHVEHLGLQGQSDIQIWRYAAEHDFVIVSKDDDFRQLGFLHGAPHHPRSSVWCWAMLARKPLPIF